MLDSTPHFTLGQFGSLGRCKIIQVIDKSKCLIQSGDDFAIVHCNTTGLTDGKQHHFGITIFEVSDTTTYKTVVGSSNTVFVLTPLK